MTSATLAGAILFAGALRRDCGWWLEATDRRISFDRESVYRAWRKQHRRSALTRKLPSEPPAPLHVRNQVGFELLGVSSRTWQFLQATTDQSVPSLNTLGLTAITDTTIGTSQFERQQPNA